MSSSAGGKPGGKVRGGSHVAIDTFNLSGHLVDSLGPHGAAMTQSVFIQNPSPLAVQSPSPGGEHLLPRNSGRALEVLPTEHSLSTRDGLSYVILGFRAALPADVKTLEIEYGLFD